MSSPEVTIIKSWILVVQSKYFVNVIDQDSFWFSCFIKIFGIFIVENVFCVSLEIWRLRYNNCLSNQIHFLNHIHILCVKILFRKLKTCVYFLNKVLLFILYYLIYLTICRHIKSFIKIRSPVWCWRQQNCIFNFNRISKNSSYIFINLLS